jgi:hypothetical protein
MPLSYLGEKMSRWRRRIRALTIRTKTPIQPIRIKDDSGGWGLTKPSSTQAFFSFEVGLSVIEVDLEPGVKLEVNFHLPFTMGRDPSR